MGRGAILGQKRTVVRKTANMKKKQWRDDNRLDELESRTLNLELKSDSENDNNNKSTQKGRKLQS